MPKTNSRKLRNYEHQDFNALLSELKNEKPAETDFQAEAEAAVPKPEKQVFSLYRQRIFSNENVNYIYSVSENILHEKHCLYVKAITDEELRYSETYLSNMRQCPACAAESYLRIGAKDPENSEHYKRIFELCGITQKQLRNIYLVKGMKTRISGSGFLISYKKDTWKIRLLSENGHVQLLHNNYRVLQNGQRQFVQGFHVQNPSCEDTNFGYALGIGAVLEQHSRQGAWTGGHGRGRKADNARARKEHDIPDEMYRAGQGTVWPSGNRGACMDAFYKVTRSGGDTYAGIFNQRHDKGRTRAACGGIAREHFCVL